MIIGIGTDIVEISRIEKACENPGFLKKYFTTAEIELFANKRIETVAGNFACKESCAKAFGLGFRGFSLIDIEVLRDELNKPIIFLHRKALEIARKLNTTKIHASISHSDAYATAFVILEDLC